MLTVLGEAERFGAVCVNGARAVELIEEQGKAVGVVCEEAETGERFAIAAANVVNATGVWADRIRPEELHGEEDVPVIRPSRGTHVLLDREQLPLNAAVVVPGRGRSARSSRCRGSVRRWSGRPTTTTRAASSIRRSRSPTWRTCSTR